LFTNYRFQISVQLFSISVVDGFGRGGGGTPFVGEDGKIITNVRSVIRGDKRPTNLSPKALNHTSPHHHQMFF